LNQRPLGYERLESSVSKRKQGTSGNSEEPLETGIGDLMKTDFSVAHGLPNDPPQFAQWRVFVNCRIQKSAMNMRTLRMVTNFLRCSMATQRPPNGRQPSAIPESPPRTQNGTLTSLGYTRKQSAYCSVCRSSTQAATLAGTTARADPQATPQGPDVP